MIFIDAKLIHFSRYFRTKNSNNNLALLRACSFIMKIFMAVCLCLLLVFQVLQVVEGISLFKINRSAQLPVHADAYDDYPNAEDQPVLAKDSQSSNYSILVAKPIPFPDSKSVAMERSAIANELDDCIFVNCSCISDSDEKGGEIEVDCKDLKHRISNESFPKRLAAGSPQSILITSLSLPGIGIANVPDEAFSNLRVQQIDLSSNTINEIAATAFLKADGLIILDLENNKLGQMPSEALSQALTPLVDLSRLILAENHLSYVPNLVELHSLEVLSLKGNEIDSITSSELKLPATLLELDLSNNKIM